MATPRITGNATKVCRGDCTITYHYGHSPVLDETKPRSDPFVKHDQWVTSRGLRWPGYPNKTTFIGILLPGEQLRLILTSCWNQLSQTLQQEVGVDLLGLFVLSEWRHHVVWSPGCSSSKKMNHSRGSRSKLSRVCQCGMRKMLHRCSTDKYDN